MLDGLFSIVAPHYCYGCGQIGDCLCDSCKNDILLEADQVHIKVRPNRSSKTINHHYDQLISVSSRTGVIEKLIDAYKFDGVLSAYRPLADLIIDKLDSAPGRSVLVPIPTAPKHIRIRGYDHIELITRRVSAKTKIKYKKLLYRKNNLTQHFAKTAKERKKQALSFFGVRSDLDPDSLYILIDDIITTGSTLSAAAKCLKDAGAKEVIAVVLARQE